MTTVVCVCGHPRGIHEHYGPGGIVATYCAAAGCDCTRYRRTGRLRRLLRRAGLVTVLALAAPAASDAALPLNCSGALPPGAACHIPGTSSTTSLSLGAAERTVASYWNTPEAWFVERCGVAPSGWVGSTSTWRVSPKTVVGHVYVFNSSARLSMHAWAESVFGMDATINWGGVWGFAAGACVGY